MIAGSDGNISVRLDKNRIIITPSGKCKGTLAADDMVTVDRAARHIAGKNRASSELMMHLYIYEKRPDIFACVHAHPVYATAFAVAGKPLSARVLPEILLAVGEIALTEYAPPGTEQVGRSLQKYVENHNAFLLKNHGLVTVGENLEQAYQRQEMVEHFARILYLAHGLGKVDQLPDEEIQRLKHLAKEINDPGAA
jgi:L-fuculose-phosphate aldolase